MRKLKGNIIVRNKSIKLKKKRYLNHIIADKLFILNKKIEKPYNCTKQINIIKEKKILEPYNCRKIIRIE